MSWLRRLNYFEPARLRAIATAALTLAAALGISVPAGVPARIDATIAFLAVIAPLVQGELTRRAVISPATADRLAVQDPTAGDLKTGSGDLAQ